MPLPTFYLVRAFLRLQITQQWGRNKCICIAPHRIKEPKIDLSFFYLVYTGNLSVVFLRLLFSHLKHSRFFLLFLLIIK